MFNDLKNGVAMTSRLLIRRMTIEHNNCDNTNSPDIRFLCEDRLVYGFRREIGGFPRVVAFVLLFVRYETVTEREIQ